MDCLEGCWGLASRVPDGAGDVRGGAERLTSVRAGSPRVGAARVLRNPEGVWRGA